MSDQPNTDLSRYFTSARTTPNGDLCASEIEEWMEQSMKRYDLCDETCTVDCGHCKGAGRPADLPPRDADSPAGEIPPMTAADAMAAAIERSGLNVWAHRDAVVAAAVELHTLAESGADLDSTAFLETQGRMFDAVKRYREWQSKPAPKTLAQFWADNEIATRRADGAA